jgi:long-chain acyl-CoA synthetase
MMAMSLNRNSEKIVLDGCAGIAEILDRAIALYPQRPALVIAGRTWSYKDLGNLVDAASFRLKKIVPVLGSRIVIVGRNHLAYIVAYWSAQRLGFPTVEIDRNESIKTVMSILGATHAQFVVTDRDDLKLEAQGKFQAELFDEFLTECGISNGTGIVQAPKTDNISRDNSKEASIVYTSGTTSSAKGVVLSHGNFCFIAHAVADYLELTEEDRCALVLPLYHTYGKSVLLSASVAGAAVVVLGGFSRQQLFLTRLSEGKCTVLSIVPYHLHVLVKSGGLSKHDFSSLRAITSSANKLSPAVIDNLSKILPGSRIFSMYGLTEATTRASYVPPELLHEKKSSCGRPLPRVEIRIVAEDGHPTPTGVMGEILLRGPNIMKGYWGDVELTKASIVDGWLKTGDIGHLDEDGFLYIDGRMKDIIKCAGERINPLEIEEVLMEHPGVEEAAVIGRQDSLMGEIIHAYVTLRDLSLKTDDLRNHCYARLSHHKVPYQYTIVESFPRTGTGKIQKNILAKGRPSPIGQPEPIFKE